MRGVSPLEVCRCWSQKPLVSFFDVYDVSMGKIEYERCMGTFLRVTKTVMIAMIVEANPKDKAMISLLETGGGISHVTRLWISQYGTYAFPYQQPR